MLGSGPSVWFARVPGADGGPPAAIGRCVVDGRWAGFAAVEVDPEQRRQGLATAVMAALARRALDEGASAAWLQVEADNAGARALYDGMGFAAHHAYHHYREPDGPAPRWTQVARRTRSERATSGTLCTAPVPILRPSGPPSWRRQFAEEARSERPDLAVLCLLMGAEADGTLDEAGHRRGPDRAGPAGRAAAVPARRAAGVGRGAAPNCWAGATGSAGTPADYQRLESSLLHEVLRRRRGLPILLSVVWMEVARRAGAPVYGVALPGHFVVGFGPAGAIRCSPTRSTGAGC